MANSYRHSPLLFAILKGNESIMKLLLTTPSININIANSYRYSPLSLAISKDNKSIIKLLLTIPSIDIYG